MNATFTNVIGLANVLECVKECWASLYGERVLAYRVERQLSEEPAIAVIIQKMIFSEVSGVIFTADPTTGARDRMIIESVFGQGEAMVSGRVEPDTYIVDKAGPQVISVRQGRQKFKIVRGSDGADLEQPLDDSEGGRRTLTKPEIIAIAELGLRAERHYGTRKTWNGLGRTALAIWSSLARSPRSTLRQRLLNRVRRRRPLRLYCFLAWQHLWDVRLGECAFLRIPASRPSRPSSWMVRSWLPR
jgi:phosphoenolpyruvate synthase/pyruvate phosphate dikinase